MVGIEKDFTITCNTKMTIEQFKVHAMLHIKEQFKRFRLFLAGREMMNNHLIGNYNLANTTIVQAYVSNVE